MDTVKERIELEREFKYERMKTIHEINMRLMQENERLNSDLAKAEFKVGFLKEALKEERNKAIEFVIQCINKHQKLPDTDTSGFYALENLKEELTAHREHLNH